jgi:hypothetical protein
MARRWEAELDVLEGGVLGASVLNCRSNLDVPAVSGVCCHLTSYLVVISVNYRHNKTLSVWSKSLDLLKQKTTGNANLLRLTKIR